ncbi:2-hydroxyisoflavanone dehydratase-like [Chenopodium quinoa]|uniref:Alpha/beta hydrolase fold-3 domain-containing protein n=1 Tax=Chenopodium quinoa TaxID=63459 RepID=A0A803NAY4_CHEQI|nr:2-hydroxyisoflavanone dehydratase-like [Chenopodium quinoa]
MMNSTSEEVKVELPGFVRVYKDGSVERLFGSPLGPPTLEDPKTGVSSKDVTISSDKNLSARLYLPKLASNNHPILVYFHGGGFCVESAFSLPHQRYMNILASQGGVVIVSVEYRLAPEHPLPTAYEDCWTSLNWVASLQDPWLASHGSLDALFIGGDSSGANIAHNLAIRAGTESLDNGVKILGAFISHSHLMDDPSSSNLDVQMGYKVWNFVYPDAPGGSNSHMINPMADGAPSLAQLGCSRVLVIVAEKEGQRDTEIRYYNAVRNSGFQGSVELFETKGEGHCFHIFSPDSENAKLLFQRLTSFLHK